MRNRYFAWMAALVMILLALAGTACAEEWTCPVCGQTGNTGNFCPACGTKAPAAGWFCPECGQENTGNFCINCGAQKPGSETPTEPAAQAAVNPYLEQIPGETDRVKVSVDTVDATSYIKNADESSRWLPINAADNDESTCWQFSWKKNQSLTVYLSTAQRVDEIWFKNGFWAVNDKGKDQYPINARPQKIRIEYLFAGESTWRGAQDVTLQDQRTSWQTVPTGQAEPVTAFRITVQSIYKGSKFPKDVCLSEVMPVLYAPASSAMPAEAAKAPRVYESRPDITGCSLTQPLATRTGPSTVYAEPGTFFGKNAWKDATVLVLKKAYGNGVWWVQVDFSYGNKGRYRIWTGVKRVDVDLNKVREEGSLGSGSVGPTTETYFGPGGNYAKADKISITKNADMIIWGRENGFLDIEYSYYDETYKPRRIWVPESACYGITWGNDNSGEN